MADNQIQEDIVINMKQVGVDSVETMLENLYQLLERLPKTATAVNGPVQNILNILRKVNLGETFGSKEAIDQLKALQVEMKGLQTIAKATELFDDSDLRKLENESKIIRQLERQYARLAHEKQVSSGSYGLDTTSTREAEKKLRELEKAAITRKAQISGSYGDVEKLKKETAAIEQNTQALRQHIEVLNREKSLRAAQVEDQKLVQQQVAVEQKRQAELFRAQEAGNKLRIEEERRMEYQRVKAQEAGNLLNETGYRDHLRRQLLAKQKEADDEVRIEQKRQVELFLAQQRGNQLNEEGYRAMLMKKRQEADAEARLRLENERKQQLAEYNFNREAALRSSFKFTKDYGAASFQKVDTQASARIQVAQQHILELQNALVDRIKQGNMLDDERLMRLKEILAAKREEISLGIKETNKQKELEQIERSRARTQGTGGAALLMVQTALMANYAILNKVVSGFRAAVTTAVEYEAALKNVQAVTATTSTEMEGLDTTVRSIAASSKFSAVEVANAALILGQAGLSAKQVAEALGPVTTLANAAGTSIASAVDLVTSVVGVFDKTAADTADVANKITQAANDSKVSVEKLALAFQYVGNTAAQMGISFEETTAALATMSNAGIKSGSTMGTGLRQFLTEVQKPSQEFINILHRLGLSISDLDFKAEGFVGVTKKLREAGFTASDAIKSFDVRGAAAFNSLLADPEEFARQLQVLQDTRAAVEANAIQMDSLSSQSKRLATSFGNLAVEGFKPVSGLLKEIFSGISSLIQGLTTLTPLVEALGSVFTGLLVSKTVFYVGGLVKGFSELGGIVGMARAAFLTLNTAITGVGVAAEGTAVSVGILEAITGNLAAVAIGLGTALAVGGYAAYSEWANSAAKETDELKAKLSEAKGTIEEKTEAIKSLDKKIQELTLREDRLKTGSVELTTEILEANNRYSKWGVTLDSTSTSVSGLIAQLKGLREEIRQLSLEDLKNASNKAEDLAKHQAGIAREKYGKVAGKSNPFTRIDSNQLNTLGTLVNTPGGLSMLQQAGLSQFQINSLKSNYKNLSNPPKDANGNVDVTRLQGAAGVSEVLGQMNTAKLEPLQLSMVQSLKSAMDALATATSEARRAQAESRTEATKVGVVGAYGSLRQAYSTSGYGSFQGVLDQQFNLNDMAKSGLSASDAKNPVLVEEKAKALYVKMSGDIDKAIKAVNSLSLPDVPKEYQAAAKKQMVDELNQRRDGLRKQYETQVLGSKSMLTDQTKMSDLTVEAELRMINRNMKPGTATQAQYDRGMTLISKKYADNLRVKNFGLDPVLEQEKIALNTKESQNQLAAELQQFTDRWHDVLRQIEENSLKAEKKSLDDATAALLAKSKETHNKANSDLPLGQIAEQAQTGLQYIAEARALQIEALDKEIARERTKAGVNITPQMEASWARRERELQTTWDTKAEDYINSFHDVMDKSAKKMEDLTKMIKGIENSIKDSELAAKNRLYAADAALRANSLELARANGPVSSRGVSLTEGKLLSRQREKLQLSSVQRQISVNQTEQGLVSYNYGNISSKMNSLVPEIQALDNQRAALLNGRQANDLTGQEKLSYNVLMADLEPKKKAFLDAQKEANTLEAKLQSLRKELDTLKEQEAGLTETDPQNNLQGYFDGLQKSWDYFKQEVQDMNPTKVLTDGATGVLENLTGGFANFFSTVSTRSKTAGEAFRSFASSVIKSMLEIVSQALAMQSMKAILGLVGMFAGSSIGVPANAATGVVNSSAGTASSLVSGLSSAGTMQAASGGYITKAGKLQVRHFAGGGAVTGGISNRDSVPAWLMPGEFVLKKKAVDTVGTDYLHSLNSAANTVVSSGQPVQNAQGQKAGGVVNVWVVSPDQKPNGLGPNDVVVAVADNISRNGTLKSLIKQVQMNQV